MEPATPTPTLPSQGLPRTQAPCAPDCPLCRLRLRTHPTDCCGRRLPDPSRP